MRTRLLLTASTIALVTASCAQTEPQVLSEASRSDSATALTSSAQPTERESQPGRFIARCATEADGGTPGMTFFTDGSQNVTDHCLSRYYIGVQPAPGALYVADEDAGTYAPTRPTQSEAPADQWTPAQPRTDLDALAPVTEDSDDLELTEDGQNEDDRDEGDESTTPGTPVTPPTDPSTPTSPTTPGETEPTTPGEGEPGTPGNPGNPGDSGPTTPGQDDPATPGSSEPKPSTVPTATGPSTVPTATEPQRPAQSSPLQPFGSSSAGDSAGPRRSAGLPTLPLSVPLR